MLRRSFLTAVPGLPVWGALATMAKAGQPDGALSHGGRVRLSQPLIWTEGGAPSASLVTRTGRNGSHILSLEAKPAAVPGTASLGLRFAEIPGFRHGVAFWRYAPWKAWTKPMAMTVPGDLKPDDVQCAYWQYDDGAYAVALPLGGGGFRTTLGGRNGELLTVCRSLGPAVTDRPLPQVAIGFGSDLYATMAAVVEDAMTSLNTPENLRKSKTLPEALTWLGWNTWNASNLGHDLSADWVVAQVDTIHASGVPIRTVVLDDGHFQARDGRLQSQAPDPRKFPGGFKPVVDTLLGRGLKHVGLWHAFDAYWNGIDPDSALGQGLKDQLFTWNQAPSPVDTSGTTVTYSFLKPDPATLDTYFDTYHSGLRADGFTLIKVDNQLVAERMASGNYPVWDLAKALHGAINKGAARHFDNAIINCMDMTNDAFLNFGGTPVARSVEDYFPYKPGEGYDLQQGNAAAHVLQAMYNALYFGEMVFPDFDMFESTNPNASLHAAVRAANCAPIYVTDKAGEHDVALLKSLVDAEGRTLRADTPLRPVADCLFQLQAPKVFKASSRVGEGALLLLANLADADLVEGAYRLSDITGLASGDYAVYLPATRRLLRPKFEDAVAVRLKRLAHDLVHVAPIIDGTAVLGMTNKLNGLACVTDIRRDGASLSLTARDEGTLVLWRDTAPNRVAVDGKPAVFRFSGHGLEIALADGPRAYRVEVA